MPTPKEYRMIKLEFNPLNDNTLINAADHASYIAVKFESRNPYL